jgi:hypothetical protein
MEDLVRLSASRVKCANECSWRYYCKYVLKIPDTSNDGARRGNVTHAVLETLLRLNKPRRKQYAEAILDSKDPYIIPSVKRMIRTQARHFELELTEENEAMVKGFILVALKFDFYLEGLDLQDPELAFDHFEDSETRYRMIGFIDKFAISGDYARIVDYKTSKAKFSEEEIGFSIQALMYMLALKKLYPNLKKIDCDFLFLKFSQKPLQRVSLEGNMLEESLRGVEEFLHYMSESLLGFDLDRAVSNFAADSESKKWLCGRNPKAWKCPYRNEVKYYVVLDKDNNVVTSDRDRSKLCPKEGQTIKARLYTGCPKYPWENK